ncbi:MAG: hypothetical protein IJR34_07630 [Bacteroidales bacterium]|nr:hypothetical protein [Bacteroidales bacterium]
MGDAVSGSRMGRKQEAGEFGESPGATVGTGKGLSPVLFLLEEFAEPVFEKYHHETDQTDSEEN